MIKVENYGKITENSRNLPENSLKNPKNLPPSKARRTGGCFANFFNDRGGFGRPPPLAMLDYIPSGSGKTFYDVFTKLSAKGCN